MKPFSAATLVVAAFALALYGCNREQSEAPKGESPAIATAPAPQPVAPAPIPPSTELPLNSVDSVMLSRPEDQPASIVIHVSGSAISAGWTEAKLAEEPDSEAGGTIKSYKFLAISPETPGGNRSPQPVEVELRVDSLPAEVTTIRIVAATNELSVPIAQ